MKTNKIYLIAALLGTVLAGCQKAEELNPEKTPGTVKEWRLVVKATKNADTRALTEDGNKLNASWELGEKVAVYFEGEKVGSLEVTLVTEDEATLEGLLTGGTEIGSQLTLLYPGREDEAWSYAGQDGSVSSMGALFDYTTAVLEVTDLQADEVNESVLVVTDGDAEFTSEQSVYRFGFINTTGTGGNIPVIEFTVKSPHLVQSLSWDNNAWAETPGPVTVAVSDVTAPMTVLYASLRNSLTDANNTEADTYRFQVIGSNHELYLGEKEIPARAFTKNGNLIKATSIGVEQINFTPDNTVTVTADGVL